MVRPGRVLVALLVAGCGSSNRSAPDLPAHGATGPLATVTGMAHRFGPGEATVAGATISVAEAPGRTAIVDEQGAFRIEVPSGGECSFTFHKPGFHDAQTAALPVGAGGLERASFQVPTDAVFNLLAGVVRVDPDPARCQIASTVSRAGTEPYGGDALGEPGVIVSIDPPLPVESGPVYFDYHGGSLILPDRKLTATTVDGGVLFLDAPPGEYRLTATKPGKRFTSVKLRCRAGLLVNAAPPWGLQEIP